VERQEVCDFSSSYLHKIEMMLEEGDSAAVMFHNTSS
jgi:hypothetical protein